MDQFPTEPTETVFAPPVDDSQANVTLVQNVNTPFLEYTDGVTGAATFPVIVPDWATSISKIEVLFRNTEPSTDLYLSLRVTYWGEDVAIITDSQAVAAYTTNSTDNSLDAIEMPAAGYDAVTSVSGGNILAVYVERQAGSGSDTYNAVWDVIGVRVTFA